MVDVDPFAGMEDTEVLARAAKALRRVAVLPPGSIARAIQWAVYESAKEELDRRIVAHVIAKLEEQ